MKLKEKNQFKKKKKKSSELEDESEETTYHAAETKRNMEDWAMWNTVRRPNVNPTRVPE